VSKVVRRLLLAAFAGSVLLGLVAAPAQAAPAGPVTAADPNANLVSATVMFTTQNDNKDWDTLLTAEVDDVNGNIAALAQDFYGEFTDHSRHAIDLTVGAATAAELNGGQVVITIAPNGNDTWIFGFSAVLTFDDGKFALCGKGKVVLNQDSRTVACTLKTV
jgi:hypothetical protein